MKRKTPVSLNAQVWTLSNDLMLSTSVAWLIITFTSISLKPLPAVKEVTTLSALEKSRTQIPLQHRKFPLDMHD